MCVKISFKMGRKKMVVSQCFNPGKKVFGGKTKFVDCAKNIGGIRGGKNFGGIYRNRGGKNNTGEKFPRVGKNNIKGGRFGSKGINKGFFCWLLFSKRSIRRAR